MRFTADGVDIPDDLLWAHDDARVVFFCGAGVSLAKAGLPDFDGLTRRVLDALGATDDDPARKLYDLARSVRTQSGIGVATSDQIFQLLRRNFTDADIGAKVAESVRPEAGVDLSAHKTLLKLGTLQSGQTRIVTTNFDRLFEACNARLACATRSTLPRLAFNEADWGVIHLHGCVTRDYSGPTDDGFVLSSAEFGDAYLAMGWARDFVREVLDRYVAVFVGYSADDPPIRYLLEGLQQSRGFTNRAYAFQSGFDDQAVVSWNEKGVDALLYPVEQGDGHRRLWDTLDAWAKRTKDPAKWRSRVLKAAQTGPKGVEPHQRGMVAHIVSSAAGAQAFAQHRPVISAEWLCVFDPQIRFGEPRAIDGPFSKTDPIDPHLLYHLDSDPAPRVKSQQNGEQRRIPEGAWSAFQPSPSDLRELGANQIASLRGHFARTSPYLPRRIGSLASWIAVAADQPAAAWWAGQQAPLHHEVLTRIRLTNESKAEGWRKVVHDAWRAILECHDLQPGERDRVYDLRLDAQHDGWREPLARAYAKYFSPRLKLGGYWRKPIPPEASQRLKVRDLVNVDVEYPETIRTINVPDEYLATLLPKLRAALELAEDLETRYSYSIDICSIMPDEEDEDGGEGESYGRHYKLSGHVLLYVKFFERLSVLSPDAARAELATWPRPSVIFDRLRIWALGILDLLPASAFAAEVLMQPDDAFWSFRGGRDLLLGLAAKWSSIERADRKGIERRLLKGPPRYRYAKEEDYAARSAHHRLSRLNWLSSRGCKFTFDLETTNEKLRGLAPEWKPEYAANAAESHDGKGGWVRTITDFGTIEDMPANAVIPYLQNVERRPPGGLVEHDPFLGLSKERPENALAALAANYGQEPFARRFWDTFLRMDIRKEEALGLSKAIAVEVLRLTDRDFALIARSLSDWFEKIGPALYAEERALFGRLWNKFIEALKLDQTTNQSSLVRADRAPDWVTESINSAPGNLAELAISIPHGTPEAGQGLPRDWLSRVEQLLSLAGDGRRYALVIVAHQLDWLHFVDPKWTAANILGVLEGRDANEQDKDAIWAGFFWRARTPPQELFMRLKPHLLDVAARRSEQRSHHVQIVAGLVMAGWGSKLEPSGDRLISSSEMRRLLLDADPDLRQQVIWYLERWSREEEKWSGQTVEFLRDAWPKQKAIRSSRISARLLDLALSEKANFTKVAALVAQLVTKVGDDHLLIPDLRNEEETIAGRFPEETLALLHAVLPESAARWPYGANVAVSTLGELHPAIRSDPRYVELESRGA